MYVDINGEEGFPWWWLGGNNNSSGGYQPDYNSNPGSNSGNNFHNNYSGLGSGYQGGGNSGYNGGNYSGNTTAAGSILFSFLSEIIYGSGSSGTNKPNPYVGLDFKPTVILSVSPARKNFTPLSKPVGTGASMVYSGGGNRRGNMSSGGENGNGNKYGKIIGYVSISISGAVGGGLAGEVGYVYTNKNYMQYYMSGGTTLGFGGNATVNIGKITALPGKNPYFDNFEGASVNGGYSFSNLIGGQVSASQTYIGTGLSMGLGAKWNKRISGGQGNTILLGSPIDISSRLNISRNNCFGGYVPY